MLSGVSGIVVHDHWQPYFTMPGVEHALCNAHHLREPGALSEIEQEDWSRLMQTLSCVVLATSSICVVVNSRPQIGG